MPIDHQDTAEGNAGKSAGIPTETLFTGRYDGVIRRIYLKSGSQDQENALFPKGWGLQEEGEGRIARGGGWRSGCPKWGVAQKLGETRQNGAYGVFRDPPIPMHTPRHENRATAVLTPLPGITASAENPDSRPLRVRPSTALLKVFS